MLKRVLVAALVLLLTSTPLVLAQDTGQQQQSSGQNQDGTQEQIVPPNLDDLAQLDSNNNLVINCAALLERLTQLQQISKNTIANNPQLQLVMVQAEDLAQVCKDKGFMS